MASVQRYDTGTLAKVQRTDTGWVKVSATVGRGSVILPYQQADGSVRRELRLDEEVFKPESLATLELVPVTNGHPPRDARSGSRLLDAKSAKAFSVGHVGDKIERVDSDIRANLMVTDGAAIADIEAGKRAVSPGYETDLDFTPGEFQGQKYDAIQRNIRYNHVALCEVGRQPGARLRLDSADNEIMEISPKMETEKVTINGVDFDVPKPAAQAFKSEMTKSQARADSAEAQLASEKKARTDAEDPKRLQDAVSKRVQLQVKAAEILGATVKLDELSDDQIRTAVVAKVTPALAEKAKDPQYAAVAYDMAVANFKAPAHPSLSKARTDAEDIATLTVNAEKVRADTAAKQNDAWKLPIPGSTHR